MSDYDRKMSDAHWRRLRIQKNTGWGVPCVFCQYFTCNGDCRGADRVLIRNGVDSRYDKTGHRRQP